MADASAAPSLPPHAALRDQLVRTGGPRVPVLPALRTLLPGGLRAGSVVGLDGSGSASLGVALVAGASLDGGTESDGGSNGWCAVVGVPEFGVLSACGMGADPRRLLLVDDPAERWPDVVAALVEAVSLVLVRPSERPAPAAVRRLTALARKHGSVLALTGPAMHTWPGVRLRLAVTESHWEGLGDGHGVLGGRRALVVAQGHDAPGAGRREWLWLPSAAGQVEPAEAPRARASGRPVLEVVRPRRVS
ncbi:hypothetical protein [Actinomadura oligospora]|uniref:hypothetical protein n=1 Tax=Actinomadura oligospora TaxID=111804 RepID=UPI0004AC6C2B|nr:hypothetical protein [Actinomadura oligospora]